MNASRATIDPSAFTALVWGLTFDRCCVPIREAVLVALDGAAAWHDQLVAMEHKHSVFSPAAMLQSEVDDLAGISARGDARDSLFLQADVTVPGWPAPVTARLRNLSPGGMLAESVHHVVEGTVLQVTLPNVGAIAARCVWSGEGRFGVAFDHAIEAQAVRRRSAANLELPPTLLGQPRRTPKIYRPLRPV
jgi:PilZ domain